MERIEKWKKEFIDMDDVVSDDDMLASLQKRLSGEGKEVSISPPMFASLQSVCRVRARRPLLLYCPLPPSLPPSPPSIHCRP